MTVAHQSKSEVIYPDSDGQPMADNTKQFRWIVLIKENLEYLFLQDENVFVAGDLLWYPVEGRPDIRVAPDVLIVLGRPKGDRGSYRQWQEDGIPPHVIFEILSPGNTTKEMSRKLLFYNRYGVEEYYLYDPDTNDLTGLQRVEGELSPIETMENWVSPRLGIRFELTLDTLNLYDAKGNLFLTPVELREQSEREAQRADQERLRADQERLRADQERLRADQEKSRADQLARKLRELGVDPDAE